MVSESTEAATATMTPAERIRAQAKEATRMALLQAGLDETVDRGGEIPSIEKVCARAGYTRGAFYVYFRDREHFVGEMLDWVLNDIIQALFDSATGDATDIREIVMRFNETLMAGAWPDLQMNIRAGYLAVLRELRPGSAIRGQHAQLMQGIAARLEARIRVGQARQELRGDVDAGDVAMLLLIAAIGAIVWTDAGIIQRPLGESLLRLLAPD